MDFTHVRDMLYVPELRCILPSFHSKIPHLDLLLSWLATYIKTSIFTSWSQNEEELYSILYSMKYTNTVYYTVYYYTAIGNHNHFG